MAPIASSIEIERPLEEVFAYITDPSRLAEWQQSLLSAQSEGGGPLVPGSVDDGSSCRPLSPAFGGLAVGVC